MSEPRANAEAAVAQVDERLRAHREHVAELETAVGEAELRLAGAPGPTPRAAGGGFLVFCPHTSGYELIELDGPVPAVGSEVELGERRFVVSKLGPSPLPDDRRPCAYLQQT